MSLLSSIIIPKIEKELLALEPEIAEFLLKQLKFLAQEFIDWTEKNFHTNSNMGEKNE